MRKGEGGMTLISNIFKGMVNFVIGLFVLLLGLFFLFVIVSIVIAVIYYGGGLLLNTAPVQNFIGEHQVGIAFLGLGFIFFVILAILGFLFSD